MPTKPTPPDTVETAIPAGTDKREAIARIIDPSAWCTFDEWEAWLRGEGKQPDDPEKVDMMRRSYERRSPQIVAPSLAKADAILSAGLIPSDAGEVERLKGGEWFYPEGDHSSDECRFSPEEVIDYALEGEWGSKVVAIERAASLPTVYAAVRVYSDAEKDARNSDDEYDYTLFATVEEARAALSPSPVSLVDKGAGE